MGPRVRGSIQLSPTMLDTYSVKTVEVHTGTETCVYLRGGARHHKQCDDCLCSLPQHHLKQFGKHPTSQTKDQGRSLGDSFPGGVLQGPRAMCPPSCLSPGSLLRLTRSDSRRTLMVWLSPGLFGQTAR